MPENDPTPEQLEAAKRAGWNPADGEPPVGWDGHTLPPEVDDELGHNGVAPPGPDEPVYVAS